MGVYRFDLLLEMSIGGTAVWALVLDSFFSPSLENTQIIELFLSLYEEV